MAIDTREKRASAAGCGRTYMRSTYATGTIDEAERKGIGHSYNGNAFTPAAVTTIFEIFSSPVIEAA